MCNTLSLVQGVTNPELNTCLFFPFLAGFSMTFLASLYKPLPAQQFCEASGLHRPFFYRLGREAQSTRAHRKSMKKARIKFHPYCHKGSCPLKCPCCAQGSLVLSKPHNCCRARGKGLVQQPPWWHAACCKPWKWWDALEPWLALILVLLVNQSAQ